MINFDTFIFLNNYSSETDTELKKVLELFETKGRYDYWSEQISSLTLVSCDSSDNTELQDASLNFLRSWRSFLMVFAEPEVRTVEIVLGEILASFLRKHLSILIFS